MEDFEIINELRRLSAAFQQSVKGCNPVEAAASLTRNQAMLIAYIAKESVERKVYQRDIEKRFMVRRSTATEQLNKLEAMGMIERKPSKLDGRLKEIELTDKARKITIEAQQHFVCMARELKKGISQEEFEVAKKIISKVTDNLLEWTENVKNSKKA